MIKVMKIGSRGEFLEHYILLPPEIAQQRSVTAEVFFAKHRFDCHFISEPVCWRLVQFFYFDSIDTLFCFVLFLFRSLDFYFFIHFLFPVSFFQVAIIAGNFELAELIKNHKETDIGKRQRYYFILPASRHTLLNLSEDPFQILPRWHNLSKWPPRIIPAVGLRQRLPWGSKFMFTAGQRWGRLDWEKWSMPESVKWNPPLEADWSVSWSVVFCT